MTRQGVATLRTNTATYTNKNTDTNNTTNTNQIEIQSLATKRQYKEWQLYTQTLHPIQMLLDCSFSIQSAVCSVYYIHTPAHLSTTWQQLKFKYSIYAQSI